MYDSFDDPCDGSGNGNDDDSGSNEAIGDNKAGEQEPSSEA